VIGSVRLDHLEHQTHSDVGERHQLVLGLAGMRERPPARCREVPVLGLHEHPVVVEQQMVTPLSGDNPVAHIQPQSPSHGESSRARSSQKRLSRSDVEQPMARQSVTRAEGNGPRSRGQQTEKPLGSPRRAAKP
jgi:hypothetical protein